ncbi:MAG: hypothetical protein ABIT37_08095 [Luteolibacter sp.]
MSVSKIFLSAIATLSISGCVSLSNSARQGRVDAQADISRGQLAIESAGMPFRWDPNYKRLLRQRYGIEFRIVGGCMITEEAAEHLRTYNEVMMSEITRKYGSDVLEKTEAEAKKMTSIPSDG